MKKAAKAPRKNSTLKYLEEHYPDNILMDGYDDCIIGICERINQEPIIAYDTAKVIEKLMNNGMSYSEALEFFEFNQVGSWVGDKTPCFITILQEGKNGATKNEPIRYTHAKKTLDRRRNRKTVS